MIKRDEAVQAERDGRELLAMLQGFTVNRKLTYELLDQLSEEALGRKWPRPGLDTFSKHFQEMALVEQSFTKALYSGIMDFSPVPDVFAFMQVPQRERLRAMLGEADASLAKALQGKVKRTVRWDDITIPIEGHFTSLISHEVYHHGQMTLALYALGLDLPESWKRSWALPSSS
jgi:uncharacterized damage-inducible protein DinB